MRRVLHELARRGCGCWWAFEPRSGEIPLFRSAALAPGQRGARTGGEVMEEQPRPGDWRYRVRRIAVHPVRFATFQLAEAFAHEQFHDRHNVVILEKRAPSGCWLELDRWA